MEEVKRICYQLRELPYVDTLVLDTEIKSDYPKMDLARDIASWLAASYHTLEACQVMA
ncbi:MAG: hypothetical protein N2Z40_02270 [Caldimicrobium sp.]|nr:hypothetical protein [Caldimicrobium sp.]MCX7613035.1 hypothetical protein [Caldimicrobium sp.]MDW8182414.1 hypothetical protein [Caldimicrobium sp.]